MASTIKESIKELIKFIVYIILEGVLFYFIITATGKMTLPNFETAFLVIVLLSLINALLWPFISYFSLRFIVITLGIGTFIIDGIILYIMSLFIPGVHIEGTSLLTTPLIIGLISSFLSLVLNIDDDNSYYQNVLEKEINAIYKDPVDKEGFIFLEIDGLSYNTLQKALDRGDMPTLSKWIEKGDHKLTRWETDLSSQTSASQAGILHGNNSNIPAFRWVEKDNDNRIISSNGLENSEILEKRISDGKGLLSNKGASRSNLFSGDAEDYILTFSNLTKSKSIMTTSWYYLYSKPYVLTRIALLLLFDIIMEVGSRIRQLILNIQPRLKWRGFAYYIARIGSNVAMREAVTYTIIGDIIAGQYNAIYATYMGYDEIAHHTGVEDYDAFYSLRQIDKQLQRIEKATEKAQRKYKIIVLSDHGQSNGFTFKQKYGITLKDLVSDMLPDNISIHSILHSNDDYFRKKYSLEDYVEGKVDNTRERIDTTVDNTKERIDNTVDNAKERIENTRERIDIHPMEKLSKLKDNSRFSEYRDKLRIDNRFFNDDESFSDKLNKISSDLNWNISFSSKTTVSKDTAQAMVLSSGNLGLIYFTDWSNRMTYEQIEDAFPGLLKALSHHDGIGFVMVKSSIYETVVLSKDSVLYLESGHCTGEKFYEKYGDHIIEKLRRTDSFEHVPDILVNSDYDVENDEVYAFEELIGNHGGAGGNQQYPFILYPSDWELDEEIFGAENVNKFFMREMEKSWNRK